MQDGEPENLRENLHRIADFSKKYWAPIKQVTLALKEGKFKEIKVALNFMARSLWSR